jgi:predicted regulator of Ras-like GTPase activity (Roadblock/LC7/MglB family)
MLAPVDAAEAIRGLTELSPQVRQVVLLDDDGAMLGTNAPPPAAERLAQAAAALLREADALRGEPVAQLEAATAAGSVFVVRDGGRTIAATTSPEPTVGLVFYDLKTCLRSVDNGAGQGSAEETPDAAA